MRWGNHVTTWYWRELSESGITLVKCYGFLGLQGPCPRRPAAKVSLFTPVAIQGVDWQVGGHRSESPLPVHVLFTRDVPKANCLTQELEPMSSPLPSMLQNLQNTVLNPQPNLQPAAQPAAGQPIPLAPVEHVQPLK